MRSVGSLCRFLAVIVAITGTSVLHANPPANLFYDSAILFDVRGVNPWPDHNEDPGITLDILPFYQHASGAKNCRGQKVQEGDRLGRMNMIGLLQGRGVAPVDSFDAGKQLGKALNAYDEAGYGPASTEPKYFDVTDQCFTGTNLLGRYSVDIDYERFGLRGQLRLNLGAGFGITGRSGAVCYKQVPCFLDLTLSCSTTESFDCSGNMQECEDTTIGKDQLAGFDTDIQSLTRDNLTSPQARCQIAKDLCIDLGKVSRAAFEDTHIDFHWSGSFGFDNQEGNHIVSVIPFLAAGIWLPTGEEYNPDIFFRLPTGNDGFWGYTLEGMLNFDFPETVTLGFGGAATFFPDSKTRCLRMPTSCSQDVLYPWKAETTQEMGTTWHVHGDLMAKDFLADSLSFYASYIYTKHQQDEFSLDEICECSFLTKKAESETQWETQLFHVALDYRVTKNLYFGFGVTGMITGRRAYRPTLLIGTIRFYF